MRTLLLFFSLFLFAGCNTDDDSNTEFQPIELMFTTIGPGSLGGDGSEGIAQSNLLINNTTDWEILMAQMDTTNNVTAGFTETDIDFTTYSIIAIFLETKSTGWFLEITTIVENENNIPISTNEIESDVAIITQPFHIVKIPKTDKPIELE